MKLLSFLVALAVAQASATDVWYPDSEAKSANGHYLATGKSPANVEKAPKPFQKNFTFALQDLEQKKVLWSFNTGNEDEPGGSLFVSDNGWVIRLGGWQTLWLIRPSGEQIRLGNALKQIPEYEIRSYCKETTAGTFWSQFSWMRFSQVGERSIFYIRTYWGRYLIVDLKVGKLVTDKEIVDKIEPTILDESRAILSVKDDELLIPCPSCGGKHPDAGISRALLVLEMHKITGRERIITALRKAKGQRDDDPLEYIDWLKNPKKSEAVTPRKLGNSDVILPLPE
jgi:hypothetical protein